MKRMTDELAGSLLIVLVLGLIALLLVAAAPAAAEGQQRPIEDFVNRQGEYCINEDYVGYGYADPCPDDFSYLIVPPVANFIGWSDPAQLIVAAMDYAGLANECAGGIFGTEMTGSITERPLADGRAEVHVRLRTTNALTFVAEPDPDPNVDPFLGPLLFGQRLVTEPGNCGMLPEGTEASLGRGLLKLTLINTAPGAPLPDLVQLFVAPEDGQELTKLSFYGQADGLLADGTPGRVEIAETGLLMTHFMGATADGFPVEQIVLRSVGH